MDVDGSYDTEETLDLSIIRDNYLFLIRCRRQEPRVTWSTNERGQVTYKNPKNGEDIPQKSALEILSEQAWETFRTPQTPPAASDSPFL